MGVTGGDREGRLLVSRCSTDKDRLIDGFQIIPPITFLQYWLFTDLKRYKTTTYELFCIENLNEIKYPYETQPHNLKHALLTPPYLRIYVFAETFAVPYL